MDDGWMEGAYIPRVPAWILDVDLTVAPLCRSIFTSQAIGAKFKMTVYRRVLSEQGHHLPTMALARYPISEGRWDGLEGKAAIPTNIHLDLIREGRIPDPFPAMNEKHVQWVHDQTWTFRTSFKVNTRPMPDERFVLVLDGLDTFATVSVDGKSILTSENMFLSHRLDVTEFVTADPEAVHEVEIVFEPALHIGDKLLQEHGKRVCWNGHYSRVFVRKAQYHYVCVPPGPLHQL